MNIPIDWLLEGDPWVVYRTRLDLLQQAENDPPVQAAHQAMLEHPAVHALIQEVADWPGQPIASHKSASQLFHKLDFLADIGVQAADAGLQPVMERILGLQSAEGPFQQSALIAQHYGGSGQEVRGWALCDAPLVSYALGKMGLAEHAQARRAVDALAGLGRDNGWPCVVSAELGSFRGPGRKEDPCPFATLAMLKAVSQYPQWADSPVSRAGVETLLSLWQDSRTRHPYIFYMGNDFRKLKAPLVWYDLLHVLDVLALFPWALSDPRFLSMVDVLRCKANDQGQFTPESVWMAWKDWEFGQKKQPSRWLSLLSWRILTRAEGG